VPFVMIKGTFHVAGGSPDGDSIHFNAADPTLFGKLDGRIKLTKGHAQLRVEGIDALETHWTAPGKGGGTFHQPRKWADKATDRLLDFVGIRNVKWNRVTNRIVSADDGTTGFILSRAADKFGRPVSFVFAGAGHGADGSSVTLDPAMLRQSYNYHALAEGLAFPTFYVGLFAALRKELTHASEAARNAGKGLWPDDVTNTGFNAKDVATMQDKVVILPKLFRRIALELSQTGSAIGFKKAMIASKEAVMDITDQNFTHFDTFIDQPAGSVHIRLTRRPEDLVFDPMPLRKPDHFTKTVAAVHAGKAPKKVAAEQGAAFTDWAQAPGGGGSG
jgi:endonuclease YncB( thermonuclease family)